MDADKISHSILKHGMPVHRKVVEAFKSYPGIVKPDGNIDRAELRKLVFSGASLGVSPSCLPLHQRAYTALAHDVS